MSEWPATGNSEEEIEDIVGAMAEAGYGLAYDDPEGLIKKTREGPNPYDAAQSFAESDVTVREILGAVIVSDGRLKIPSGTATIPDGSTTYTNSDSYGVEFEPKVDADAVVVTLDNEVANAARLAVADNNQNVVAEVTGVSGGNTYTIPATLTAGNTYFVGPYDDGNSFTQVQYTSASYPYTSDTVDVVAGVKGPDPRDTTTVTRLSDQSKNPNVTGVSVTGTAATAAIEWPRPTDIFAWDVATFTATKDGETVDVFVAYNDGSGWTRTNNGDPISRNYSLADDANIEPSDEVRIEAELSRSDIANNPTLDSAYRSWIL